jgi:hypothetical protein
MTPPERGRRKTKWVAVAAALSWAVLGLLWAQVLALPHPFLPPPSFAELLGRMPATTRPDRFIIMLFKETSLLLTAFALLGLLMCALAGRAGASKSSLGATSLCVTIALVSLVPVVQATKTASAEGVPLSHGIFRRPHSGAGAIRGPFSGDRDVRPFGRRGPQSGRLGTTAATPSVLAAAPDRTQPHRAGRR